MNANDLQKQVEERALSFIKLCHESGIPALYCIKRDGGEMAAIFGVSGTAGEFQSMIGAAAANYASYFGPEAGHEYIQLLGKMLMSIDKEEFVKYCEDNV